MARYSARPSASSSSAAEPLLELKQKTLLLGSAGATQFQRQAERKLMGTNVSAADPAEADGQEEVGDPGKQFDTARKMSTLLLDRSALVPVSAAALLPLVAAGATQLPSRELLEVL